MPYISTALHSVFTHLENKNSYVRMLFVGFSLAFKTISTMKLTEILWASVPHSGHQILDFLKNRPQTVPSDGRTSSTLVLNNTMVIKHHHTG